MRVLKHFLWNRQQFFPNFLLNHILCRRHFRYTHTFIFNHPFETKSGNPFHLPSPRKSSGYWDLPRPTTSRFKICFTFDSLFFIPAGPWQMPRACRARVPFFMYVLFCMGRNEPLWVRVFEHGMLQLLCTVLQQHSVIGSFPIANGGCNSTSERLKLWKWAVHQNSGENICWCRL